MYWESWSIAVSFLLLGLQTTLSTKTKGDGLTDPYAWDYDRTTKTNRGTDGLTDPYAWDYDHTTKANRGTDNWMKPDGKVDCSSDLLKAACAGCSYDSPEESPPKERTCGPNDIHLFLHVARSISENFELNPDTDSLVLTVSSYRREKLRRFVNGEDVPKVDIKDMLQSSWSVPPSPASSEPYRIAGYTMNEVVNAGLIILLFFSIFVMSVTFHVSLLRVLLGLCFTAVIMSFFSSYMFLYQKKIAERMADDALREEYHKICKSSEKQSIFSVFKKVFRRDDACEKYFHDHQVHIAWEVLPVEAVTHTFGAIMTSISGFLGVSLGEISGGFLGSLSVAMWLPATLVLLLFVVAILAVCLYCGGRQQVVIQERPYRRIREGDRIEQLEGYGDYDAYREDRGDRRLVRALPREIDDDSRGGMYIRDDRIEETPPQRNAGGGKGRDNTENVDRHWNGVDDVRGHVRDHPDRSRAYESNLRYRGGSQSRDVGDQKGHGDEDTRGGVQRSTRRMDGDEIRVVQQQATCRTVSRGSDGDAVNQGVRGTGAEVVSDGTCEGGGERVEEVTPRDQSLPESTEMETKPASPEVMDPAQEGISDDDFEVIPEE